MNTELAAALLALVGVVISVSTSLFLGNRQLNAEIAKVRTEVLQTYTGKLLERRLQQYPEIACLLSAYIKQMEVGAVTQDNLGAFFEGLNELDSRLSILFSDKTSTLAFYLRQDLRKCTQSSVAEFAAFVSDRKAVLQLRRRIEEFELALKSDLGIFVEEYEDAAKRFGSYKDVAQKPGSKEGKTA